MLFHRCFFGNLTPVKFSKLLIASILMSWLITGCSSLRPTQMLPTYLDSVYTALPALSIQEVSIEAGDRLEITFAGKSVEVTAALNNFGVAAHCFKNFRLLARAVRHKFYRSVAYCAHKKRQAPAYCV